MIGADTVLDRNLVMRCLTYSRSLRERRGRVVVVAYNDSPHTHTHNFVLPMPARVLDGLDNVCMKKCRRESNSMPENE